jgi:hypothetical protein
MRQGGFITALLCIVAVVFLVLWFEFFGVEISMPSSNSSSSFSRCALLVYGVRLETLNIGGSSIRTNVVDQLKCDVFVFGRDEEGAAEAVKKAFGVVGSYSPLKGLEILLFC